MGSCEPCNRNFLTFRSFEQHLESKHPQTYCSRCQRRFLHSGAKQQHVANSPYHHVCRNCSREPDFSDEEELNEHLEIKHHICVPCDRTFFDSNQHTQHDITVHNKCELCGEYYDSLSNLKNHRKTHAEKATGCLGCTKTFISNSAMVLHLEAGYCGSGADEDFVTEVALECYQSDQYTSDDPGFDFQCPTCDIVFSSMGALLQHAESDACDEHLGRNRALGKFLHYLRRRLREV